MRTVLVIGVLEICGTAYWASETMVLLDQPFSPRAKLLLMFGYWQVIMGFLSAGIDGELEGIRPDSVRRVRTCDDWSEAFWWAVIYLLVPVTACFLM
jgi:hypothetical protein